MELSGAGFLHNKRMSHSRNSLASVAAHSRKVQGKGTWQCKTSVRIECLGGKERSELFLAPNDVNNHYVLGGSSG